MKIKKLLYLIIIMMLTMGLIACQDEEKSVGSNNPIEEGEEIKEYTPVYGGEVIIPLTNFDTLNPLLAENNSYYYFSKLMFEGLFEFDKDLNVIGQLAETYDIKEDGRTIEIKLKDNVFWHDGEEFGAEDVEFTINTIKYASLDSTYKQMFFTAMDVFGRSDIKRIMDINIIDNKNIVITFDRSFSNNLEVLTFPIIPKHLFATGKVNNSDYIKALEIKDYTPVGTGQYKFEAYEKMKEIRLIVNEDYREGRAYIDHILGRVLESEEDILTAFETGQVHMATSLGVDWDKYGQNSRVNAFEFVSNSYEFIGYNFEKEIFQGDIGEGLRRAITYGIDRQGIIQKLLLGHGSQVDVPIHPDSWLFSEKGNTFGYNLELAKEELSKLGLKDSDGDGILEDENGENISIRLVTNTYNQMRMKMAEMIKEDLKRIGIEILIYPENTKEEDVSLVDIQTQWEEVNHLLEIGDYDISLLGWQLSVIPDLSFAFHSSQINYKTNFINYSNEHMDELLQNAFLTGLRNEKLKAYDELQGFIVGELPYTSLFFKNKALLVDSKIIGELNPVFFNPYKGIERCYIPEELQ